MVCERLLTTSFFKIRFAFYCLVALLGIISPALAGPFPDIPPPPEKPGYKIPAPVIVDGQILFYVVGISSYPSKVRAKSIAERIVGVAADTSISSNSLNFVEAEHRTDIKAGDKLVMVFGDVDAEFEGVPRSILAELKMKKIQSVIESYRKDRSPRALWINSGIALGATFLLVLLLWVTKRIFCWSKTFVESRIKASIEGLEEKTDRIIHTKQLWAAINGFMTAIKSLTTLILVFTYLNLVLGLYPWTRHFSLTLFRLVIKPLREIGVGILNFFPSLVFLLILTLITRYALKVTKLFFAGIGSGRIALANFDPDWAFPTYRIIRLLIVVFSVVVAYPYLPGSGSQAFKGISIFLGLVFSLGSTSIISHVLAGYTMAYRRAFKIGDCIKINDIIGEVMEVGVLVTRLNSLKNEEVVIPNSTIINSHVVNYSKLAIVEKGLILHTSVGVGYDVPWRQVEAMLEMAANRTKGLKKEPPPFVLESSLGDFAINYELNAYCGEPKNIVPIYAKLNRNILDVFNEYEVEIMSPAYREDTEKPKLVPKSNWYAPPAKNPREKP